MTTYPLPELLRLWRKGELTAEQARPEGPRLPVAKPGDGGAAADRP